jgi:pimeloyl-ACP methyl ester carboxylesterase
MLIRSTLDSWLARWSARRGRPEAGRLRTHTVDTAAGALRVFDSATTGKPCVVLVPDGPNVIEHHERLIHLLSPHLRVVCFDMPGFGFSVPRPSYAHSLDQGAHAVLEVLDRLGIGCATLAFSCANGFYALRASRLAPPRVTSLFLAQTPSLAAMHRWTERAVPSILRVPIVGQVAAWQFRRKAAQAWYGIAVPSKADRESFRATARHAFRCGACFSLAGVVQALMKESPSALQHTDTPCTMVWGAQDRSHRHTTPASLLDCVPNAEIIRFEECGHFPDLEQPERYAQLLLAHIAQYGRPAPPSP